MHIFCHQGWYMYIIIAYKLHIESHHLIVFFSDLILTTWTFCRHMITLLCTYIWTEMWDDFQSENYLKLPETLQCILFLWFSFKGCCLRLEIGFARCQRSYGYLFFFTFKCFSLGKWSHKQPHCIWFLNTCVFV